MKLLTRTRLPAVAALVAALAVAFFTACTPDTVPAAGKTPAATTHVHPGVTRTATPSPTATSTAGPPQPTASPTATPTRYPADFEPPDLRSLPPTDLFIQPNVITGRPELRFTSSVVNLGLGPLYMVGEYDEATGQTRATQHIRTANGPDVERLVGHFVFHPQHDHWHFDDFNLFELWSYTGDGELGELLSTNGKASWCITETSIYDPLPEIYDPFALLAGCDPEIQALANGWVDTYDWGLPGQELDLTGLPDGRYAFVSTVDPDDLILETDETNNAYTMYIELRGNEVIILDGP